MKTNYRNTTTPKDKKTKYPPIPRLRHGRSGVNGGTKELDPRVVDDKLMMLDQETNVKENHIVSEATPVCIIAVSC